jgi:hypothetical protein
MEDYSMSKFEKFKSLKLNGHGVLSILTTLSCSVLLFSGLGGCTTGMFGDLGGQANAQIIGNTYPAVDPASVQVKDLIPAGGDSISPTTISSYENSVKGIKVAQIRVRSTGYGDDYQKALDKLKDKAANLGANLILITAKNKSDMGMFGSIEGANGIELTADAYHLTQ